MCGESSSGYVATVVCNGSVGLRFTSMVDFKIHSLTFTSCGRSFDENALSFGKYALHLGSIEYAELVNCSFHDNLGTALAVYHSSITLAGNNEFTHNYWYHEEFIPNNRTCIGGGGITALDSNLTFIGNTTFLGNHAIGSGVCGGAIYAVDSTSLRFTGTSNFINNSADFGGAIFAWQNISLSLTGTSNFISNSAFTGGAIAAVNITSLSFTGTSNFINNSADWCGAIDTWQNTSLSFTGTSNFISNSADYGGAIEAFNITSLSFTGTSNFISNSASHGGAILGVDNTSLSFAGTGKFISNSADEGGGVLLWNSTFSISSNTTGYWESNHARSGGAICAANIPKAYCTQLHSVTYTHTTKDKCFFQLPGQNLSNGIDAQFVFNNNSADDAGSVLYGGAIDNCQVTDLESYSSGEVFDMLVHIENDNTNPIISSDPFHICPCENNRPDCSKSQKSYTVYPGETFRVSVIAFGQRNGVVPANVRGRLTYSLTPLQLYSITLTGNLHPLQYLQTTFNSCTILNYTVFSLLDRITLQLYADSLCSTISNDLYLGLYINQTCPPGFYLSEIEQSCVCNQRLAKYTKHCDITDGLGRITRSSHDHFWVGMTLNPMH